jgi:hypothetical protein
MRDVQQQGPGAIGHVRGALAGQAEAHIVFGKQHVADALPILRFVFADPENLREGEVGERWIARELDQALQAKGLRQVTALLFGTHVAPDQCRANYVAAFVEKNGAVHLAGETDRGDVFAGQMRRRERLANCDAGGAPPVFRLLFGPADLWSSERLMIRRCGGNQLAAVIDYDGPRATGADVNSEKVDKAS